MSSLEERIGSGMIQLKHAVALYKKEERAPVNTYDWYRKSAQACGSVLVGNTSVDAFKLKNIWYVNKKKLDEAIQNHRKHVKGIKENTVNLARGMIMQGHALTESGGYISKGDFRLEWSDYERVRKRSIGTWYCNTCNRPAETEHKKEECHLCSDWYGCNTDCTLSRVYCDSCKKSMNV